MSTFGEILRTAGNYLKQHAIADADVDAWYLLVHVFGINRADFYLHRDEKAPKIQEEAYMELIGQRAKHIPLQLITGTQEFMGLEFDVTSDVLIPRQDTEVLVEEVLKVCNQTSVLDMCTGSGCIIISLAKLGNIRKAVGADLSDKALKIAEKNAEKHNIKVEFIRSNLFEKIEGVYDIVVSNPPYIPSGEIKGLMPEVRDHEPIMALDGDQDGLAFYRRIAEEGKDHLKENGTIFLEIGYNQAQDVKEILQNAGFGDIKIRKDLSGLDRVVSGRRL